MGYPFRNQKTEIIEEMPMAATDMAILEPSRGYRGYVPWVAALVAIIVWEAVAALHLVSATALPSPVQVFRDLIARATTG